MSKVRLMPAAMAAAVLGAVAGCGGGATGPVLQHTRTVDAPMTATPAAAPVIPTEDLAPVKLDRVEISIPAGTAIGRYQFQLGRCTPRSEEGVYLRGGRKWLDENPLYDGFHTALRAAHYNVADGRDSLFDRSDVEAEYLVGANITHAAVSLCDRMNMWTGFRVGGQEGSGSVAVDWEVYSTLSQSVVYRTRTDGVASLNHPVPRGAIVLIYRGFKDAARALAADPKFREALARRPIHAVAAVAPSRTIVVPRYPPYARPFTANADRIVRAAVTIDLARGHGSGFFISRNGLLLTNQHVVGDAETVRVRLYGGTSVRGEVLRRDAARDIALVKIDAEETQPLAIRTKPLDIGEEVYAIGTPLGPDLTATVTKGVVSATRHFGAARLPMIQADVDIHGGSSGGALLDRHGNVVGIAVAGLNMLPGKRSVGLNLFIPIADALEHLDLSLEGQEAGPGA